MAVLSIVCPVFLVVLLGGVLTRARFLSAGLIGELNRLTYFVGLPAYLFSSIAAASYGGGRAALVFCVMAGATLAGLGVAWAVAKVRRVPPDALGTFLQAAIRGNLAYIGLPVVALALAAHGGPAEAELRTTALLAMAPLVVITNGLGVVLLLVGKANPGAAMWRTVARQLATNPLLLSSLAGAACAAAGLRFSGWFNQSVAIVGQMALPLALLCIGGTLVVTPLHGRRSASITVAVIKVAVLPAIGLPLGRWLGLSVEELRIALLFLACPTAAASFTLAGKLGGDEALAAGSVVASTALAVASLSAVLVLG